MLLLARLSPVTNSPLNTVFTFTPLCRSITSLYNVSHSFKHCTTGVFQKLLQFDVIGVNYRTGQYTIFERRIDLSPNESLRVIANTCIITSKMYKMSLQSSLCTLESCDLGHQRLSISNRQTRTL